MRRSLRGKAEPRGKCAPAQPGGSALGLYGAAALAIALVLGMGWPAVAQRDEPGSPRAAAPLTILQLNDVYSITPVEGGVGGLARVATLKQTLAAAGRTPLLMIAGDFLSSSVESTVFKGEQMIATLNAAGLDVATLGNHEFDFGVEVLLKRMSEAKFDWVISNVIDRQTGKPVGGAAPYLVRTFGTLKVGIIGLCLATEGIGPECASGSRSSTRSARRRPTCPRCRPSGSTSSSRSPT